MEFLSDQLDNFLRQAGLHQKDILDDDEPLGSIVQYGAAAVGVSAAAFLALCCLKCIAPRASKVHVLHSTEDPRQMSGDPGAETMTKVENTVSTKENTNKRIPNKKHPILNLKRHDLRNFDDEMELASFYSWRESLSIFLEPVEMMEPDMDGSESMLPTPAWSAPLEEQTDNTDEFYDTRESNFDKYYSDHPYLPPFVKNIDAVEKYTETMIAILEDHKATTNIHYNEDNITFDILVQLLDHDIVPFDVSPEKITRIVAVNRNLSSDEMLEIMCRIYDLCLENKVAEWSLHYRKAAQPYFRNRHYRKQFQTRPVNDLLQDIQNYYNPPD